MIVSEKNIQTALEYLADDPHPVSIARKFVTDCENRSKELWAKAYLAASGSIEARKANAELDGEYITAKRDESTAIASLERHRSRIRAAEMLIEVWRTENANARRSEKVY